ncbi:MAG: class I SAM-dependent methyltransferase [Desulfuromonadales bacterium]|jgi:SAM-dependent methyltransferase
MTDEKTAFWERPEVVDRFAGRDPDVRLSRWLADRERPEALRVLDIGCAGGRNAELLARAGCDLHAIDASEPMIRRTRVRVGEVLGEREAARRIRVGRMENLGAYSDGSFDLVVALGVHHSAPDRTTYERAVAEAARVLDHGGHLLVANFGRGTELEGTGLTPVEGEPGVFEGHASGRHYLLDADELDELYARHGLFPAEPTRRVEHRGETSRRITINGLYRKD